MQKRNKKVYTREIDILIGKTLVEIDKGDYVMFTCEGGYKYKMYHDPIVTDDVYLEDVKGDMYSILNSPILNTEKNTKAFKNSDEKFQTCTSYTISTAESSLTFVWKGLDTGFNSAEIYIELINKH